MNSSFPLARLINIRFDLPIRYEQLPQLRGAIIRVTGKRNDLFHNHGDEAVIYRYPQIQYKRIKGKAALVCLGEGTEAIHNFFFGTNWTIQLGPNEHELSVEEIKATQHRIQTWDHTFNYRMANWLPLNQENYLKYSQAETFHEKMKILEQVLTGNLLTFCEGLNIRPEKEIKAAITRLAGEKVLRYRGQLMQAFDVDFRTNLSLPDYIGLGKGVSIGFGMITQSIDKQKSRKNKNVQDEKS